MQSNRSRHGIARGGSVAVRNSVSAAPDSFSNRFGRHRASSRWSAIRPAGSTHHGARIQGSNDDGSERLCLSRTGGRGSAGREGNPRRQRPRSLQSTKGGSVKTRRRVFWLSDHPDPAPSHLYGQWQSCRTSPRLQRRDRNGFGPFSPCLLRSGSAEGDRASSCGSRRYEAGRCAVKPTFRRVESGP